MHFAVLGLNCIYYHFFNRGRKQKLYHHTLNIPALILDRLLPSCHYPQKTWGNIARPGSKVHYDLTSEYVKIYS